MNIIKLKDIIMPGDSEEVKFFNEHLKGRYAYWLHMRYIVSFDSLSYKGYVRCEEDISRLIGKNGVTKPFPWGVPYWDVYDESIIPYIDSDETDKINSIQQYSIKNKYISDSDITIDELRIFRTWLATELLKFDENPRGIIMNEEFTEKESHMLEYYKNNMYDNVIKHLNEYSTFSININKEHDHACSCCGSSDISSLYKEVIDQCDSVAVYKHNLYSFMVQTFSEIDFWKHWPKEFILVFKKYIDNIINMNLPLTNVEFESNFQDCNCIQTNKQDKLQDILKRLSISLEYIANEDINGHKNYISDALKDWSSKLYENMIWI